MLFSYHRTLRSHISATVAFSNAKQMPTWSRGSIVMNSRANAKSMKCLIWSLSSYPITFYKHHSEVTKHSSMTGNLTGFSFPCTRIGLAILSYSILRKQWLAQKLGWCLQTLAHCFCLTKGTSSRRRLHKFILWNIMTHSAQVRHFVGE